MRLNSLYGLLALGAFVLGSCHTKPTGSSNPSPNIPETELNAAQPVVTIDQVTYTAEVFPYRDFMPGPSEQERGMIAITGICRSDSLELPQSLHLERVWIFYGHERWFTELSEERPDYRGNFCRQAVARGGPKWEPGSMVDVVIGFSIGDSGVYLIRTATTKVERTE